MNIAKLIILSLLLVTFTTILNAGTVFAPYHTGGPTQGEDQTGSEGISQQETQPEREGVLMSGTNLNLIFSPALPFDRTTSNMVTLSFVPTAKELEGSSFTPGKIDHLDYEVMIAQEGKEVWSKQFHDHDGTLDLQITPSSESLSVTGGKENQQQGTTAPYMIKGPILMENGNYVITGKIVGIEFNPIPVIEDNFSIQVIPEFPTTAMLPVILALGSTIIISKLKTKQL